MRCPRSFSKKLYSIQNDLKSKGSGRGSTFTLEGNLSYENQNDLIFFHCVLYILISLENNFVILLKSQVNLVTNRTGFTFTQNTN